MIPQFYHIGDREFRSVELADWLKKKKVFFALRIKQDTYIRQSEENYQQLSELGLTPGMKLFYSGVNYTKKKGFGRFNLAAYWKRKYRGSSEKQGWFILTNLSNIDEVIQEYLSIQHSEADWDVVGSVETELAFLGTMMN